MESEINPISQQNCSSCSSFQFCKENWITYNGPYCKAFLKNEDKVNSIFSKIKKLAEEHYKSGMATTESLRRLIYPILENARWEYCFGNYNLFVDQGKVYEGKKDTFRVFVRLEYEYMENTCVLFWQKFFLGEYEAVEDRRDCEDES